MSTTHSLHNAACLQLGLQALRLGVHAAQLGLQLRGLRRLCSNLRAVASLLRSLPAAPTLANLCVLVRQMHRKLCHDW